MATILAIDDDRSVLEMLSDLFVEHGHTVETCRDGKQAIEHLEAGSFDLVVLDVLIPHVNGFALVEHMNADDRLKKIPIIVFSGIYRSLNHRQDLAAYEQVIDYLDKPLQTDKVFELAQQVLGADPKHEEHAHDFIDGVLTSTSFDISDVEIPVDEETAREQAEVEKLARRDFRRRNQNLALQGSLQDHSIAEVLGKLWSERASGALLLRQGKVKKIMHIKDGTPYSVKSNLINECLGQLLVRERLISKEELKKSVSKMKETGTKQGQILIEMGSITENNLSYALGLQLETKMFEPFSWESGEYRFNPAAELPQAVTDVEWKEGAMVVEGIRRTFDERRLRFYMGRFMETEFDYPSEEKRNIDHLKLPESVNNAVNGLPLPSTPRGLLDNANVDAADLLGVLYAMISLRILKPLPAPEA
ncbi:MAG: response regulator [Myxococcota bacterium]|nr:response regulator [Myxococcota bacterium]